MHYHEISFYLQVVENRRMPRYVSPQTPLPERVAIMTAILGVPALRAEILRYLSLAPQGATSGEVAAAIGTRYQTVQRHLDQLEELGAVSASVPAPRGGHHVVFRLIPEALDAALTENARYIQGK